MTEVFFAYQQGVEELLGRLGREHPRYTHGLTLQSRLMENIVQTERYGDTETRRAERAQIVDALNRLALDTVQRSFTELCSMGLPSSEVEAATRPTEWNTGAIRVMITASFTDEELVELCFDFFRPVYHELTAGMSKRQIVQRLIEYCDRYGCMEELLKLVQERNPVQYSRFRDQLH